MSEERRKLNEGLKYIIEMMGGINDTAVYCQKCGRIQWLEFRNGIRNGFDTCCDGKLMPIIYCTADVNEIIDQLKPLLYFRSP